MRKKEKNDNNLIIPKPSPLPSPLPSPSTSKITSEMLEHLKTACKGHKYADMAPLLEVNPITLRSYINRYNIRFTNE